MRITAGAVAAAAGVTALALAVTFWQTRRAVREATNQVTSDRTIRFSVRPLEWHTPPTVEPIASPASYRHAAIYRGRLYLCGPGGLIAAPDAGHWRPGQDLPPAPLTSLTTGLASDSQEPELWIATAGQGLLAFNGSKFRHVLPADPKYRKLTSVLALSSGQILAGTDASGVLVYDGRTFRQLHDQLTNDRITALAGDVNRIAIGTQKHGLFEYRAGELRQISGLPDPHVLSLAIEGDNLFAGTALGTALVRDGRVQRVYGEGLFAQALQATKDALTVGTLEQGIAMIPLQSGRSRTLETPGAVTALVEAEGRLLGVGDEGVFDARSGTSLLHTAAAMLTDRNVSALAEDREGRLWIGYFDRGLDILAGGARVVHVEDENVFCVNRIVHKPSFSAVATANGLVLMDGRGTRRQVLGRDQGLIANAVTDVILRDDGMVVATPAGLTFLEHASARSLYAFHGLVNNHVYALGSAGGDVLAGTLGGVSLVRGELVQANYTTANSRLPHNWITAVARVGDEWWLGTYGEGVVRLDAQGRVSTFSEMPRAIVNPNAMLAASDGKVYAGTLEHGLLQHAQGRWVAVTAGLPSLNVTAIAPCSGAICVGTDNGLVKLR